MTEKLILNLKWVLSSGLILFCSLGISQVAKKQSSQLFQIEVSALGGTGSSKIASDASSPSIGSFNLGLGLGVNYKKLTFGISSNYRILTQFSDVDATVGNRRGAFSSPISPFIRLNFERIRFGYNLIMNGSYGLTNTSISGSTISYEQPSGYRFDLMFGKIKKVIPLLFVESVDFSKVSTNGDTVDLTQKLNYSSTGVGIVYEF